MRRLDFLRCVPVGLWAIACGESSPKGGGSGGSTASSSGGSKAATGGESSSTGGASSATGGTAAQATGGTATQATGGTTQATGGATAKGGAASGGKVSTASGGATGGSVAGGSHAGGDANSGDAGDGGASDGPVATCAGNVYGAIASAADFSVNTETGLRDAHVLQMSDGSMIRRVLDYTTTGDADHQHEFRFTEEQLMTLLDGGSVVVTTHGPPLDAASGHGHTVTVRSCR